MVSCRPFPPPQLKLMLHATDSIGRTVLAMAALSGDKGTFDTVLAAVTEVLGQTKVCLTLSITEYSNFYC